jgi:hypothetical protein
MAADRAGRASVLGAPHLGCRVLALVSAVGVEEQRGSEPPAAVRGREPDLPLAVDRRVRAYRRVLVVLVAGGLAVWRPWRRPSGQTPLEILQARYAGGELEQDEYERRRQALGGLT